MPIEYPDLLEKLKNKSIKEKLAIIDALPIVKNFLLKNEKLASIINSFNKSQQFALKSLIVLGQEIILEVPQKTTNEKKLLEKMANDLVPLEDFYQPIGGIIGYHLFFLKLLDEKNSSLNRTDVKFHHPEYLDVREETPYVKELIETGIKNLPEIAMIFPMGGAGDRLGLIDPKTHFPLPTAKLKFMGRTLIEGLIRDLQAYEYLYYKLYNKYIITPIVIMTSEAKSNHKLLLKLLEDHNWFNRPKESFLFIKQLSVPVISQEGSWVLNKPLSLALKPGGHGVIWKLMDDANAFDWLKKHGRKKAVLRQINNPVAATDYGILALIGYGIKYNKAFGFAACPRRVKSAEGVNVLREIKQEDGFQYGFTNIEYTDFKKWDIKDAPIEENSLYSKFPSNTNILFLDLKEVQAASKKCPLPGIIINLKNKGFYKDLNGNIHQTICGRLEVMMQNIADYLTDFQKNPINNLKQNDLKTFITYNQRKKTISVTKKSFIAQKSILETPLGCYYDVLSNYHDLLTNYCNMKLPPLPNEEDYVQNGPSFVCSISPMLGPTYSIISKKIKSGEIKLFSEMDLEIAEAFIENLHLNGSLIIKAKLIKDQVGKTDNFYFPKCFLHNVKILNNGINRKANNIFWQNKIKRSQFFKIVLHGNSIFYAENIEFKGNHYFEVPDNHIMTVYSDKNKIKYKLEKQK